MEFLKTKMKSWLGIDATENNVSELKKTLGAVDNRCDRLEHLCKVFHAKIDETNDQVGLVGDRLEGLCDVLHVGVDVAASPRDTSWAVLAVRGNQDQVYFYNLDDHAAQAVHRFLESLPKHRCVVDAPQYLPIKNIFKF